jgi:hypothetical protein
MNADIAIMLGNLSKSLMPVQELIAGLGYLIGLLMMITALTKLKKIGDSRARGSSNEKMFGPLAFFFRRVSTYIFTNSINCLK